MPYGGHLASCLLLPHRYPCNIILTPEKWLIRKRLEVAYAMMKEGRRKIADVCAAVGFKNQSHFSTAFKRMYGVPPTAV